MATLNDLAHNEDLPGFVARFGSLPRPQVISELLQRGPYKATALHYVFRSDPSLELVTSICDVMKDDPLKTNIFEIASCIGWFPLHSCAYFTTRVEVLQFVIDRFRVALVRRNSWGDTPLTYAQQWNTDRANHAAIVRCLEINTNSYPVLLNQLTVKCCLVAMKNQGVTAIVARIPHNEQTPCQFVYELLDMMVNSEDEGDGGGHHLVCRDERGARQRKWRGRLGGVRQGRRRRERRRPPPPRARTFDEAEGRRREAHVTVNSITHIFSNSKFCYVSSFPSI